MAFLPLDKTPNAVLETLNQQKVIAGANHFYAKRLVEAMGMNADQGVVRCSFVHYTSAAEMDQLLNALDLALR